MVRCAPELVPVLRELFASRESHVRIEAAPELLPREARIHWDQGYDKLDLDACAERIRACLEPHLPNETGSEQNAERRYG